MSEPAAGVARRPVTPYQPDAVPVWSKLAEPIASDRALLGPEACALLAQVLDRYRRAEGLPFSPAVRHLHSVLRQVGRQERHAAGTTPANLDPPADAIGTGVAAKLLRLSPRHVGRLAAAGELGPVVRRGRRIQLSRASVVAAASLREATGDGRA